MRRCRLASGKVVDLVNNFIEEEYKPFPVALHDDMLDAASRITDEDLNVIWPKPIVTVDAYAKPSPRRITSVWAA
jgi:hypothetical protein